MELAGRNRLKPRLNRTDTKIHRRRLMDMPPKSAFLICSPLAWFYEQTFRWGPMVRGRYDPDASTATSYSWFVWDSRAGPGTRFDWIPPSKAKLFRETDVL